ncbi:hypothetical protein Tco_0153549 [Tanacetum coccineum]
MKGLAEAQLQRATSDVFKSKTSSKDFFSWNDRFWVYLDGLEPYLLEILENGPFVPKSPASTFENVLIRPQKQWSPEDRKLVNQDKRLKSIIISCLPNDILKSVIKCTTAKSMWNDLILGHDGPPKTRVLALIILSQTRMLSV